MGEPTRSASRRVWRRVFLTFSLFLILAGAGVWLLAKTHGSKFLSDQLETVLTRVLERPVRVDELIIHPSAGEFGVAGFSVGKGPASNESMVRIGRALVRVRMPRLWPPEIVSNVEVQDFTVELDAEQGAQEEPAPLEIAFPSSFEFGPLTVRVESARLSGGGFVYRDAAAGVEIRIHGIDGRLEPADKGFGAEAAVRSVTLQFPEVSESMERIQLDAAIDPHEITVERLTFDYDGEAVETKGVIREPFNELALDLAVRGKIPLRALNRYVKAEGWPVSGLLELEGTVRGPIPSLEASFAVRVPELQAGPLSARELRIHGGWDGRALRISELRAALFGGSVHGSFEMVPENLSQTRAKLSVTGASLAPLNALMEKPLNLHGIVDLNAEVAGDLSQLRALRARIDIKGRDIVLPGDAAELGPGRVIVLASLEKGSAELSNLSGIWKPAKLSASGTFDLEGAFEVRADLTANMTQVAQTFHWKGFDGNAMLNATSKGDWKRLRADGSVKGELVSAAGPEIGKLEVPFRLEEQTLEISRALARVDQTRLVSSIKASWRAEPQFEGSLEAAPVRMEDLGIFMPADLRATGGFNFSARAAGTQAAWSGSAKLDGEELSISDVFLKDVHVALSGNQKGLNVERLNLSVNSVPVKAQGNWEWSRKGDAKLEIERTDLSSVRGIPGAAGLEGTAQAVIEGSVNGETINATGKISLKKVRVRALSLGDGGMSFNVKRSRLNASLSFPGLRLSGKADGELAPGGNIAAELALQEFALTPVLAAFAPGLSDRLSGQLTALAKASIPYDDPPNASGSVRVDTVRLNVAGEGLQNEGPILLEAQKGTFRLEPLILNSTGGGSLKASGTLTEFGNVSLETDARLPLKLLTALSPEITQAGGALEINGRLKGTLQQPVITGEGRIKNGSVALASYPDAIREIEGEFSFTPKGGQLKQLTAVLGSGRIKGSGQVGIEGFDIGAYQAKVTARDLPVAPLEGLRTTWNADLELLGFGKRGILQGEANLLRGGYSRELSILSLLFEGRASSGGGGGASGGEEPPPIDMALKVRVNLNDNFLVRTPLARLRVGGSVTVEGPVTQPVVFGAIEVRDGYITFQKRRFELARTSVNFIDPRQIDPILDLEATSKIRQYDVTLQLSGRPQDLTITLSSDPSLPEEDLLSLVAFGVTREQFGKSAPGVLAGQAAQLIADDLFGSGSVLDNVDVDTQGDDGSTVTVGARVGDETTVSFAQGTGTNGKRKIRVEHQLLGPLMIAGGRDLEGGFETDVVLRFRFR